MSFFHAFILSLVEGLTEFLPISSTGHLILVADLLKIQQTEFVKTFEIFIQLGAIFAAIVLYARRILTNFGLFKKLIVAFIPTAIIGLTLYKFIKSFLLGNVYVTEVALFVGGLALIAFDLWFVEKKETTNVGEITYKQSLVVGFCQVLAMIPGVSRSAATIIGGSYAGISRAAAIEFSFMLAIPTMLAASVLDLLKTGVVFSPQEMQILALGSIGAFFSALLVIRLFLSLLTKRIFLYFGIYRVVLAIGLLFIR